MNILYFILTLAVFQPLTAHAEAVFDDSGSFQIARSVRLGREKASMNPTSNGTLQSGQSTGLSTSGSTLPGLSLTGISAYQGSGKGAQNSGNANINGSGKSQQCPAGKFMSASGCADCPDNGHCTGSADWMCQSGYWKNESGKKCVQCTSQYITSNSWDSKKCDGTASYTCLSSAWRDTRNSNPEQCSQCPTNATCNGTSYTCNGSGWKKWDATPNSKPNTYRLESAANPNQCPQCPTYWECNGTASKYCYGKNTAGSSWSSSYSYVSNGSTNSPSACSACGSNWECNGTANRYCKGKNGGNWTNSNAYVSSGSNDSPTGCTACPSNWECNGTTSKYCKGKNGGSWTNSNAYVSAGSNSSPTTCTACPSNGVCNGTTTFRCTDSSGNNNTSWTKTNGYHASASTCGRCTSDGAYECNGVDRNCYGNHTASDWSSSYALSKNAQATNCIACPSNASCKGTTEWRCNNSYYRTGSSYSDNTAACRLVSAGTVCNAGSTYDARKVQISQNNGNTVYCVQPVPDNPTSNSYSTVGEECPSGYVWRYRRTGTKGGVADSGIWAPGCYPKGNCNSGEACMPMGFVDGVAHWQCTSQTSGTGRTCNQNG